MRGDSQIDIPRCPYCKIIFFSYEEMVEHIANRHEGGKIREEKNKGTDVELKDMLEKRF